MEGGESWYCTFTVYLSGFSVSVLPAVSLEDGFLHCEIVEGSFRADTFVSFIQGLLENMQPFPQSNSVIVMDDSHIHKLPLIQEMISARYVGNLARYLVLTNPLPEASAVNFCPHPLQITTRSNSRSRGWSIIFVVVEITTVWYRLECHLPRSTAAFSKPCIRLA